MVVERGMSLGAHSFLWTGRFAGHEEHVFAQAAACGYDGIEIALADPAVADPDRLGLWQERYGLRVLLCATQPAGLSLASPDADARSAALAHLAAVMRRAKALGSDLVTGPMLHPVGACSGAPPTGQERATLAGSLARLAETAEREGVRVALEPLNRFQGYLLTRVDDGLALCAGTGSRRIGLLLDLFHMNIEEKDPADAVRRAAGRCFHVHVSARDRGPPGSDSFAWDPFRAALAAIGYRGWLTVEAFNFTEPEAAAQAHLWTRPTLPSAEVAAASIAHLRRVFASGPRP